LSPPRSRDSISRSQSYQTGSAASAILTPEDHSSSNIFMISQMLATRFADFVQGEDHSLRWYQGPGYSSTPYGNGLRRLGQGRQRQDAPLFADIDDRTPKYTFSHQCNARRNETPRTDRATRCEPQTPAVFRRPSATPLCEKLWTTWIMTDMYLVGQRRRCRPEMALTVVTEEPGRDEVVIPRARVAPKRTYRGETG
jgi:hypothetical protein